MWYEVTSADHADDRADVGTRVVLTLAMAFLAFSLTYTVYQVIDADMMPLPTEVAASESR